MMMQMCNEILDCYYWCTTHYYSVTTVIIWKWSFPWHAGAY